MAGIDLDRTGLGSGRNGPEDAELGWACLGLAGTGWGRLVIAGHARAGLSCNGPGLARPVRPDRVQPK